MYCGRRSTLENSSKTIKNYKNKLSATIFCRIKQRTVKWKNSRVKVYLVCSRLANNLNINLHETASNSRKIQIIMKKPIAEKMILVCCTFS